VPRSHVIQQNHFVFIFVAAIAAQRKRVGELWPGAAAQLLLRAACLGFDVSDPLFREPLAECTYREYPIDTWQQALSPPTLMLPLIAQLTVVDFLGGSTVGTAPPAQRVHVMKNCS